MSEALRLVVYDRTCVGSGLVPAGLSHAWRAGGAVYRWSRQVDHAHGVASWDEALDWLVSIEPERRVGEIQYWGHGKWGTVFVAQDALGEDATRQWHPRYARLAQLRARLAPDALLWLRTCECFGALDGQRFARSLADFFGVRVAGHTYVIGAIQSGLVSLAPDEPPWWSPLEGLAEGTASRPTLARDSSLFAPRTISCLEGRSAVDSRWPRVASG